MKIVAAPIGDKVAKSMDTTAKKFNAAIGKALKAAAADIQTNGRLNIAQAGLFGTKWQQGFTAEADSLSITVGHTIPFFSVFETGATIVGKPILWIPLSFAGKTRISDYQGGLFRVNRKAGQPPLLLDATTKQPMFVGLSRVTINKRFDIAGVVLDVMSKFSAYMKAALKG